MSQENPNRDENSQENANKKQFASDDEQEEPDLLATSQQNLICNFLQTELPKVLNNIVAKEIGEKCLSEVVQTYLPEVAKQALRPFVVDTIKQALENTVNQAAEDAVKRYNDEELQVKKERLVADELLLTIHIMRFNLYDVGSFFVETLLKDHLDSINKGLNVVLNTVIKQMQQSKGKLPDGDFVFQEKGKEPKPQSSRNATPTAPKGSGSKNSSV
eukprot:g70782.t1